MNEQEMEVWRIEGLKSRAMRPWCDDDREVPAFIPHLSELLSLVKTYEKIILDNDMFFHLCQQTGGSERRENEFAHLRIRDIADALKDEAVVQKAIDDAVEEFAPVYDDLTWHTFIGTATPEEQAKFEAERDAMLSGEGEAPPATGEAR